MSDTEVPRVIESEEIVNFEAIPSTLSLLRMEAASIAEQRLLMQKSRALKNAHWNTEIENCPSPNAIEPELHTKLLLPAQDESLDFRCARVARTCHYYSVLERVFGLEWFVRSLNFTPE